MELFEVEILREEILTRIQSEEALDQVKKYTLSGIVKKTQKMATLQTIQKFLLDVERVRLEALQGVIRDAVKAYEEESRLLMKEIEVDYHNVQQQELMRLMQEL